MATIGGPGHTPALAVLRMGRCIVEQDQMMAGLPPGLWWNLPVRAYLVRTPDSLFLFDTGMPARLTHDLWALLGTGRRNGAGHERSEDSGGNGGTGDNEAPGGTEDAPVPDEIVDSILPVVRPDDSLAAQLRLAGLTPEDLDGVITSHWHFDHAGGLETVRGRPILAQRREIESVRPAGSEAEHPVPFWLEGDLTLEALDGDRTLAPGVTVLSTPGHTPGHQSLLVETSGGAFLLTSDAVYTQRNWDADTPGYLADREAGQRSVLRLREVARATGATVVFGHDAGQSRTLRPFPFWYR